MIETLFIRRNPELRISLFIFFVSLTVLFFVIKKLSDGFLYNYLNDVKSKNIEKVLIGLHWGLSIFIALILPDSLLTNYILFQKLFAESQFWSIITSLLILLLSSVIIALILNLLFKLFLREETNNGSR